MSRLIKCPKCGYLRYDRTAQACERRQCGYEFSRSPTHCWTGNGDLVGEPATCMLDYGHDGPHEFIPDSQITIAFPKGTHPMTEGPTHG